MAAFYNKKCKTVFTYVLLYCLILLFLGCSRHPEITHHNHFYFTICNSNQCLNPLENYTCWKHNTILENENISRCVNVSGMVLGDILPNSTVFLYQTHSTNYSIVMETIRENSPMKMGTINESGEFIFECLYPGKYAFGIPRTSYGRALGYPLPRKPSDDNFKLDTQFQGGNFQWAVGVFTIENAVQ